MASRAGARSSGTRAGRSGAVTPPAPGATTAPAGAQGPGTEGPGRGGLEGEGPTLGFFLVVGASRGAPRPAVRRGGRGGTPTRTFVTRTKEGAQVASSAGGGGISAPIIAGRAYGDVCGVLARKGGAPFEAGTFPIAGGLIVFAGRLVGALGIDTRAARAFTRGGTRGGASIIKAGRCRVITASSCGGCTAGRAALSLAIRGVGARSTGKGGPASWVGALGAARGPA